MYMYICVHAVDSVPPPPSLSQVDTIEPSAGVCVREGNRNVAGPSSPNRPSHFLLPQSAMMPLHSPPLSSGTAAVTTAGAR